MRAVLGSYEAISISSQRYYSNGLTGDLQSPKSKLSSPGDENKILILIFGIQTVVISFRKIGVQPSGCCWPWAG